MILMGGFFGTALIMCVAVVIAASTTWRDVMVISFFVFVFALIKILMANALFFALIRYDKDKETVRPEARVGAVFRRAPLDRTRVAVNHAAGLRPRTSGINSRVSRVLPLHGRPVGPNSRQ